MQIPKLDKKNKNMNKLFNQIKNKAMAMSDLLKLYF